MMDFDPLADNAPPRYAVESDEEEDEYNPLYSCTTNPTDSPTALSVRILGNLPKGKELIVATGDAGKYWAKGAKLEEQSGTVQVSNTEIGLVFNPSWADVTVIISEALTRLPVWAQHSYAFHIIQFFEPTRLLLLDTYSAPIYVSPKPVPIHDAPIRYLTTKTEVDPLIQSKAEPFDPPNLLQSTSASYMSIVSTSNPIDGTLIVLPSAQILRPLPATILPPNISHQPEDTDRWSPDVMDVVQQLLLAVQSKWAPTDIYIRASALKRKTQTFDNSMYI